MSPAACNYNDIAIYPSDCEFAETGYNCDGSCVSDSDGDGVCDPFEIDGCTNINACNYDTGATEEDGSCDTESCAGCTDSSACNYDETATLDNGECDYISCLVYGCTNTTACNYNESDQ